MADPLERPLKWNKNFEMFVEKHSMYDVFQELLKEIIIEKPSDPLDYIKNNVLRVGNGLHHPRTFVIGSKYAEFMGENLASTMGVPFLKLETIISEVESSERAPLEAFMNGLDKGDDDGRKLLITHIRNRIMEEDCDAKGYILYGFPQSKAQAQLAQRVGLLPRQVFVFLPDVAPTPAPPTPASSMSSQESFADEDPEKQKDREIQLKQIYSKVGVVELNSVMYKALLKDIASAYHHDICKLVSYQRVMDTPQAVLQTELLGQLTTLRATGGPFVPRVVIMGPPGSGKSSIAEFLCQKFSLVNVDWMELLRGAARGDDFIAFEAKSFLNTIKPVGDESAKAIITKRLHKPDCEKKGWVLHGFPENKKQCQMLASTNLEPNRVFMLSCSQDLSIKRMAKKKEMVMNRHLEGVTPSPVDETSLSFPYGEKNIVKRYENFSKSMEGLISHFGSKIIYVDVAMKPSEIKDFVENSIMRPPVPQ